MTRIIGGVLGSLKLKGPAKSTRPTSDRVKESVFSILESLDAIQGAKVLDLFAGTGALGLEAASRGASEVTFVEKNREAALVCKENLQKVKVGLELAKIDCRLLIRVQAAESYLKQNSDSSLVFMDPPYEMSSEEVTKTLGLVNPEPECLIVLERRSQDSMPELPVKLEVLRKATYGDTSVHFLITSGVQ